MHFNKAYFYTYTGDTISYKKHITASKKDPLLYNSYIGQFLFYFNKRKCGTRKLKFCTLLLFLKKKGTIHNPKTLKKNLQFAPSFSQKD